MSIFARSLSSLALLGALATSPAFCGENFHALMNVARQTWPEKTRIGVICDYSKTTEAVHQLAVAAGTDRTLIVMDTHRASEISLAQQKLVQLKADFIVLMPQDPLFRDGAFDSTVLVSRLSLKGIPAIATTPIAIRQGALFCIGSATRGELLVAPNPHGTVRVILPTRYEPQPTVNTASAAIQIEEAGL